MLGNTEVYNALNVADITSLLDKRSTTDTKPALIGDLIIPSSWTAKKTINFYPLSPVNFSQEMTDFIFAVNCRASSMFESQKIAYTVAKALNRFSNTEAFFKAVMNKPIPPQDSTDTYNTQVELTVYPHNINL